MSTNPPANGPPPAEDDLYEHEHELQFALNAGGLGLWRLDLMTGHLKASPTCRSSFGHEPKSAFSYADMQDAVHAADRQRVAEAWDRAIAQRGEYSIHYRIVTPRGETRWLHACAKARYGDEGQPVAMAGTVQDVTLGRQADTHRLALIEIGDRIRDLDDTAELAFAAAEILGRTLEVSRAGYGTIDPVAETITIERDWNAPGIESLAGILNFRDYGTYIDDLKRAETVIVRDVDEDPRTRSTAEQLKAISAHSFINMPILEKGRPVALLYLNHGAARDWSDEELVLIREVAERTRMATERCRAREELSELAASLERQVEIRTAERDRAWKYSRDLQVVVDREGVVRASNDAWLCILGWRPEEVIGRQIQAFCHPDDLPIYAEVFELTREDVGLPREIRFLHKDGDYYWITWVTALEGDLIYASGRNVTDEKAAATELELTQAQLRQSQKMEALGRMTGRVAHDFNNLLTVIRSSTDLLKRPSVPEDRRIRLVEAISEVVERGTLFTSQLLSFARRQALHPARLDVSSTLAGMTNVIASLVGPDVNVVIEPADTPCVVLVDSGQFEAAILNLAMNAREAMNDEGELVISIEPTDLIPASRSYPLMEGRFVAVSVRDNGSGIAPFSLERIFEPYFSTKDVGQGTGLGLSQVFGFAKQSGGEIRVTSHLDQGSTFTLYLPCA